MDEIQRKYDLIKLYLNTTLLSFVGMGAYIFVNFESMSNTKIIINSTALITSFAALVILNRIYLQKE